GNGCGPNCFGGNGGNANAQASAIARDQVTISATATGGNGGSSDSALGGNGSGGSATLSSVIRPPWRGPTLRMCFTSRRTVMARKRYKPEEIVAKLRQVDVLVSQGQGMTEAIRQIGVSEVTYYRWRQEFGGLKIEQVKRLKELELENSRLRKAVSDLTL